MTGNVGNAPTASDREVLLTTYSVVAARRSAYDTLFWQAPVLSLTAQAFLFTVALSGGTPVWSRRIAAALALLSAVASIQLMLKHRLQENRDCVTCNELEVKLGIEAICGSLPHGAPHQRTQARLPRGLEKIKSHQLWIVLLSLFGFVAFLVIVLSFTKTFSH